MSFLCGRINQTVGWSDLKYRRKLRAGKMESHISVLWTLTDTVGRVVRRPSKTSHGPLSLSHSPEKPKELPVTNLPVSAGIVAAIVIGSLATGCIFVGSIAYLLVTRGWRAQNHRYRSPSPLSFPSVCSPSPLGSP